MNISILSGRAVDRPALRQGAKKQFCTFTLAVRRPFASQKSSTKTDYIDCIAFGRMAVNLRRHLPKGGLVQIQGSLETFRVPRGEHTEKKYMISVQNADIINWRRADGTDNIRKRLEDIDTSEIPSELDGMLDLHKANKRRQDPDVDIIPSSKIAGGEDDPYMVGMYDIAYGDELYTSIPLDEEYERLDKENEDE